MMNDKFKEYLTPTKILDSDHPEILDFAANAVGNSGDDSIEKAVKLYYAVRDGIWYDPYSPFFLPEHYIASNVLKRGRGYCVAKASLLCTLGRACEIPSRIGFADVKNHLATKQLLDYIGSDIFVYHGFVEFYLNGKWVKATPAFNDKLCKLHNVKPLEFNGYDDSIFHEYNTDNKRYMEYIKDHGSFADIPLDLIVPAWEKEYGKERIRGWIKYYNETGEMPKKNFHKEEVWKA